MGEPQRRDAGWIAQLLEHEGQLVKKWRTTALCRPRVTPVIEYRVAFDRLLDLLFGYACFREKCMELIEGRTFENEYVDVDEKQFKECTLINCVLRYSGQAVIFERTRFESCRYVFFGPARATVHFLEAVSLLPSSSEWGEYPEDVN